MPIIPTPARWWHYVVLAVLGGAAGFTVGQLPYPWPLIIVTSWLVVGIVALVRTARELRRSRRELEDLIALLRSLENR